MYFSQKDIEARTSNEILTVLQILGMQSTFLFRRLRSSVPEDDLRERERESRGTNRGNHRRRRKSCSVSRRYLQFREIRFDDERGDSKPDARKRQAQTIAQAQATVRDPESDVKFDSSHNGDDRRRRT